MSVSRWVIALRLVVSTAMFLAALGPAIADCRGFVCPADFDRFWQRAVSRLEVLPPGQLSATAPGEITFPVTEGLQATGYWHPPNDPDAVPVVHIVEIISALPEPSPRDRRGHLYLTWRPRDTDFAEWYLTGLDAAAVRGLVASVLTACQALDLLRTCPQLRAPRVGVVADGYGATLALAAAALFPARVSFVIAHQPRPAFHRRAGGALTSCPMVRRLLTGPPRPPEATVTALAYFDAVHFAARVPVPVLVIAGERDDEAPPAEARLIFDQLAGPREWFLRPNLRHRPSDSMGDFAEILARVADAAEAVAAVTSP